MRLFRYFLTALVNIAFTTQPARAVPQLKLVGSFNHYPDGVVFPTKAGQILQPRHFNDLGNEFAIRSSSGVILGYLPSGTTIVPRETNRAGDILYAVRQDSGEYKSEIRYADGSLLTVDNSGSFFIAHSLSEDGGLIRITEIDGIRTVYFHAKGETLPSITLDPGSLLPPGSLHPPTVRLFGSRRYDSVLLSISSEGKLIELKADGTHKTFDVGADSIKSVSFLDDEITRVVGNDFENLISIVEDCTSDAKCNLATGWRPGIIDIGDSGLRLYQEVSHGLFPYELALSETSSLRKFNCLLPPNNKFISIRPTRVSLLNTGKVVATYQKGERNYVEIYSRIDGPSETSSSCLGATVSLPSNCSKLFVKTDSTYQQKNRTGAVQYCKINFITVDDINRPVPSSSATVSGIPSARPLQVRLDRNGRGSFTLPLSRAITVKLSVKASGRRTSVTSFRVRGR